MEQTLTKEEYKAMKQEEQKKVFRLLDVQTERCMSSQDDFKKLLNMLSVHTATTVSNTLLALIQLPEAKAVLPKDEWERRGVPVVKNGEGYYPTGIYQFADAGEGIGSDGQLHKRYRVYKGYDASYTSNPDMAVSLMQYKPLNKVFFGISPEAAINCALFNSSPVKCLLYDPKKFIDEKENISETVGVKYIPETQTVIVRKINRSEWFARISYEIALGVIHKQQGKNFSREKFAFEATVVAYMLSKRIDLPVEQFQFDLSRAMKGKTLKEFRHTIQECSDIAHEIFYRIEKHLEKTNRPKTSNFNYAKGGI